MTKPVKIYILMYNSNQNYLLIKLMEYIIMMKDLTLDKLRRSSLAYQVSDTLREVIIKGLLPPGSRLLEIELAEKLGVSRGSLREALRTLEGEGLVETFHGKGTFIASLSERNIQEVYSLRLILETEAVRLAAEKATPQQIGQLETLVKTMEEAASLEDIAETLRLDNEFHQFIWEIADHNQLKEVLQRLFSQFRMYLTANVYVQDYLSTGINSHKKIFEGIRQKDTELAVAGIRAHLKDADAQIVTTLKEKGIL